MTNNFVVEESTVFSEKGCECGREHKLPFCAQIDVDISKTCREIVSKGGRVFLLSGENVSYRLVDRVHQSLLNSNFDVVRFESAVDKADFSLPEGCNLILGIGDSGILARCKLLSSSFDVSLVAVPTRFDIFKLASSVSELDYGGVLISRMSRKPDRIVLLSEIFANLSDEEFADVMGEFFSFSLIFCDYAYRGVKNREYCSEIINSALSTYKDILERSLNRSVQKVSELLSNVVRINALLGVIGTESGAEQLSTCIARFLKKKGRKLSPKGERLIMSAYLLSVTYANFLSEKRRYFVPDTNLGLDKTKKLFGMSEKETVEFAKEMDVQKFDYDDFIVDTYRQELHSWAVKFGKIIMNAFSVYRKLRTDSGYGIKERVSVNEMLEIISSSAFSNKDTLFSFIKERGILEFKKSKI